jgi:WD40 repeat protein
MPIEPRVVALLARYEECLEAGQAITPEELCRDTPDLLGALRQGIQALRALGSMLGTGDAAVPTTAGSGPGAEPVPEGPEGVFSGIRYGRVRFHARGGLGEVFVAEDEGLRREVALKRLQTRHDRNPSSRRRFLLEAEVTGRLEHPGVVPVYGLGQDADGRPCYAMRFIRGESFQDALSRFHQPDQPGRLEYGSAFRQLLGRLVAVCNTVAYAHSKGVLHRDLKPGNVMLGNFGETLVVDWGLAKVVGEEGRDSTDTDNGSRPGVGLTRVGAIVGTPQYMSPEQASGRPERIGVASDVYSLGAMLYVLLTGHLPFEGHDAEKILEKVRRGDFPLPRRYNPRVPRALEAVCLKALALKPEERYASALALADDLERWLAGEPVSAWREPWTLRARRWLGRHRTLVTAGAAALLVAAVAAGVALIAVRHEQRQTEEALKQSEENAGQLRQANERILTADGRRRAALRDSLNLALQQGLPRCLSEGDLGRGLLWLAHAHQRVPEGEDDLRAVLGTQVAAWSRMLHRLRAFEDHSAAVTTAAFRPDGKVVLTGCADGSLRLWDTATGDSLGPPLRQPVPIWAVGFHSAKGLAGRPLAVGRLDDRTLQVLDATTGQRLGSLVHPDVVRAVAFSPDGTVILTGCEDRKARLWDALTGQATGPVLDHPLPVSAVAFSPNGNLLLTGSGDPRDFPGAVGFQGDARVWDRVTGKMRGPAVVVGRNVLSLALSPDGKVLLLGCYAVRQLAQPVAFLADTQTGRVLRQLPPGQDNANAVAFHPDGRTVLTASNDGKVRLFEAATGKALGQLLEHEAKVNAALFSPDGRDVLTGSGLQRSGALRIWRVALGAEQGPVLRPPGSNPEMAFTSNGRFLLTTREETSAGLWDTATGKPVGPALVHRGPVLAVAVSPDGKRLLTGSADRTAKLWDAATGRRLGNSLRHDSAVRRVAFSPDGRTLLTVCWDMTHFDDEGDARGQLWDAATGKPRGPTLRHHGAIGVAAFSRDGSRVLLGGPDQLASVWDAATGQPAGPPTPVIPWVATAAFSPDGRSVFTGNTDNVGRLWDANTGARRGEVLRHEAAVLGGMFSGDGKKLLTRSADRAVRAWDARTGVPLGPPVRLTEQPREVLFSPRGTSFLTRTSQATQLWDPVTGKAVGAPLEGSAIALAATVRPGGKVLLAGRSGETPELRLWYAVTGKAVRPPLTTGGPVSLATFSPDGRVLLAVSGQGRQREVRRWDVVTGQALGPPLLLPGVSPFVPNAFLSPDGQRFVLTAKGTAELRDTRTGALLGKPCKPFGTPLFSPDGSRLLIQKDPLTAEVLSAATGQPLGQVIRHPQYIAAVAFSQDGKVLATAGADRLLRFWSADSGKLLGQDSAAYPGPISGLAFSPDSRVLVVGSEKMAQRWDMAAGKRLGEPLPHPGIARRLIFSPDGKLLLTESQAYSTVRGYQKAEARLWHADTGKLIATLAYPGPGDKLPGQVMPAETIFDLAFTPDGKRILIAYADRTAHLWNIATGRPLPYTFIHQAHGVAPAFSPDGKHLVTAAPSAGFLVWDTTTGKPVEWSGRHSSYILTTAFSPDGRHLVTGSQDLTARLWNPTTGAAQGLPLWHAGLVWQVAFSPDGRRLATASDDGKVRVWDVATGQTLGEPLSHPGRPRKITFSPDGQALLTLAPDRRVRLWRLGTGQPARQLLPKILADIALFSRDGKLVLTGGASALLWDAATGQAHGPALPHPLSTVVAAAFSPDGRTLVTASRDGKVRLWEVATGHPRGQPLSHRVPVADVAFSPDGQIVLTRDQAQVVRRWKAATGEAVLPSLLDPRCPHQSRIEPWQVISSPDGRSILTCGDHTARLWNAATGNAVGTPLRHDGPVHRAVFSPDGRLVLTAGGRSACLWEVATGKRVRRLALARAANAVAFSPDGKMLATVGTGETRLWDTASGLPIGPPWLHPGEPGDRVAFSPDGRLLLTVGSGAGRVVRVARLWPLAQPVPVGGERLRLWLQVCSGLALEDDGKDHLMDAAAWHDCHRRLQQLGGPPLP